MDILRRVPYWGFLALLVYMPFHIFLSQSLSVATGGLEAWKVGKDVSLFGLTLFTICLIFFYKIKDKLFFVLLGGVVAYALLHLILWATHADLHTDSAMLGIVYNNRVLCFLLLGYGAALLNPRVFAFRSIVKFVLILSTIVAFLGVLQYLLPKDILTHLGYSLERGVRPAFFIEDNPTLPRIMSTLREPNALGAYLVLPISILTLLVARLRTQGQRILVSGMLVLHLLALFLTHSRSAWLATIVAVGIVLCWNYRQHLSRIVRRYWPAVIGLVLLLGMATFLARDSYFFQHYIIHSDPTEVVEDLDSNDYHLLLVRQGIQGVIDEPLGHGPGTAGIVSIRNPGGGQLTENYYVQIAYETGVLGLVVFVAISGLVYWRLYNRHDWVGVVLMASFWAYVLTNMLLHTWSNEAVAAQWWLLAGAALLLPSKTLIKK